MKSEIIFQTEVLNALTDFTVENEHIDHFSMLGCDETVVNTSTKKNVLLTETENFSQASF